MSQTAYRTHHATEVTEQLVGQKVTLAGWVDRRRDHGGVAFIDLRDNTGLVQVVIYDEEMARPLRSEFVIQVVGEVRLRPDGNENEHLATGKIEVVAESIEVLAKSDALPFQVSTALENESENKLPGEDVRLKYRYLDLRRPSMQRNLKLRAQMSKAARHALEEMGFEEIETPTMIKSTPEGARDFVVPARLVPGSWYALPQSPQLLKQLLMVSGVERYYQLARCYRDEDFRADRQPEFTQLDMEMAFVDQEDVMAMAEKVIAAIWKSAGYDIKLPIQRITWQDAMDKYGSDKPDLRFGNPLIELTDYFKNTPFRVFQEEEIVVTAGATAGLNLLATAFGNASLGRGGEAAKRFALKPGDEIVVTKAEHHSVLLPFQELALRTGATLKWFDLDEEGRVRSDTADEVITDRTKIVAVTHVGNTTGAITDIAPIIRRAHEVGAVFVLDACQSVPHLKVDFHALDVDFAAWSAHKMYGPTGVGFLYGKREMLEALPPANFGGSMVELAWMDQEAQYMEPPARFEAGTQPVAQVVAAGVAAEWLMNIGMEKLEAHERTITDELLKMGDIDGIRILGPRSNKERIGTVAFEVEGVHPHDVGQFIDAQGIAIRVGHHCAQPVHRHFGVYASNRASSGIYNSVEDAQALIEALGKVRPFFGVE